MSRNPSTTPAPLPAPGTTYRGSKGSGCSRSAPGAEEHIDSKLLRSTASAPQCAPGAPPKGDRREPLLGALAAARRQGVELVPVGATIQLVGDPTLELKRAVRDHRTDLLALLSDPPPECGQCGQVSARSVVLIGGAGDPRPWRLCGECYRAGLNWYTVEPPVGGNLKGTGWRAVCQSCGYRVNLKDRQRAPDRCPGCGAE
jgi:predicted Zn-ribbon and HTH transcriptional regulator